MSKEILKSLIDLVDDSDTETLFNVLIRFIPEDSPLPDEINAIVRANKSIDREGIFSHESINWDE